MMGKSDGMRYRSAPLMPSPFDLRVLLGLPWTRMPDSAFDWLSPACYRLQRDLWAIVAAIAIAAMAHPVYAGLTKEENRHQIDRLEDAWRNAVMTSNTKAMDALLDKDYMAITPSGTLQSREDALENLRDGKIHFTTLDVSDRKVRFYGPTAIVTSQVTIQATTPDGQVSGNYWYTRVYARNAQGQWKIVSFEASRVREPGPHKRNELH
jgi:ketosteroid isomerase-like protein